MTFEVKTILVAKDLSPESSNVIRYGLELGAKFKAQVHVLHVMPTVDPAVLNMVALSMGADRLAELNKKNEAELIEKTHAQLRQITALEEELIEEEIVRPPFVEVCHGEPAPTISRLPLPLRITPGAAIDDERCTTQPDACAGGNPPIVTVPRSGTH